MGKFVGHEPCPECGSKDNLARYEDGSAWCFGCGYYEHSKNRPGGFVKAVKELPDTTPVLPPMIHKELVLRGLNEEEIKLFTWAPTKKRLCYRNEDFMEARSFTEQPKVLTYGEKPFVLFGVGEPLVVVEDIFSAIRVSRVTSAVPLFGSVIPARWMVNIANVSKKVIVWLDNDKYREGLKYARSLQLLGVHAKAIQTQHDPKEYGEEYIKQVIS